MDEILTHRPWLCRVCGEGMKPHTGTSGCGGPMCEECVAEGRPAPDCVCGECGSPERSRGTETSCIALGQQRRSQAPSAQSEGPDAAAPEPSPASEARFLLVLDAGEVEQIPGLAVVANRDMSVD